MLPFVNPIGVHKHVHNPRLRVGIASKKLKRAPLTFLDEKSKARKTVADMSRYSKILKSMPTYYLQQKSDCYAYVLKGHTKLLNCCEGCKLNI